MVRSVERMDYEGVQGRSTAAPTTSGCCSCARSAERRIALERARGGANLPMPEQEVTMQDGRYLVGFRPPLPAEDWNAQISLMTGMAAAEMMLRARVGILRTMPEPEGSTRRPVPPAGPGAGRDLARGHPLRRVPALAGPHRPPAPGADPRGDRAVPWRRLHPVRRPAARADRPRRGRGGLRPRDGAAAPAGRPVRPGHLRGAVPRRRGAGVGPREPAARCPR